MIIKGIFVSLVTFGFAGCTSIVTKTDQPIHPSLETEVKELRVSEPSGIFLRTEPSKAGQKLGILKPDTRLKLIRCLNGQVIDKLFAAWCEVEDEKNIRGYVFSGYTEFIYKDPERSSNKLIVALEKDYGEEFSSFDNAFYPNYEDKTQMSQLKRRSQVWYLQTAICPAFTEGASLPIKPDIDFARNHCAFIKVRTGANEIGWVIPSSLQQGKGFLTAREFQRWQKEKADFAEKREIYANARRQSGYIQARAEVMSCAYVDFGLDGKFSMALGCHDGISGTYTKNANIITAISEELKHNNCTEYCYDVKPDECTACKKKAFERFGTEFQKVTTRCEFEIGENNAVTSTCTTKHLNFIPGKAKVKRADWIKIPYGTLKYSN